MRQPGRAVIVFLVLGGFMMALGDTWMGFGFVAFGAFGLAILLPSSMAGKALSVCILAFICGGVFACRAVSNEITGKASYSTGRFGEEIGYVGRDDSPAKFREFTNRRWTTSGLCVAVGVVGFIIYRKTED